MDEMKTRKCLLKGGLSTLSLTIVLSGCGEQQTRAPSQVLARVNDKEITVLQLNYALSQNANLPPAQQLSKQTLLDNLVQQELLVQLAAEKKLERNPSVLQAVEYSRRQVLAQAAASQIAAQVAEPTQEQIATFYQKHPELFAARKMFRIVAFMLNQPSLSDDASSALNRSTSASQSMAILKQHKIEYAITENTAPAEVFPEALIARLSKMKPGELLTVNEPGKIVLLQLLEVHLSPVSLEQAHTTIANNLRSKQMQQAGDSILLALRKQAKVELLHDFSAEPTQLKIDKAAEHMASGLEALK